MKNLLESLYMKIKPAPKSSVWEDYFHGREALIWEGAPVPGIKYSPALIFMSIFGVPFLGAGLTVFSFGFSQLMSLQGLGSFGVAIFLICFSIPFLSVGLALVFGIWIAAHYAPQFVRYALTNKRAYIAKSWWSHTIESFPITADTLIELKQGRQDSIYFTKRHSQDSDGYATSTRIGFEDISDGATVYAMLRKIQEETQS